MRPGIKVTICDAGPRFDPPWPTRETYHEFVEYVNQHLRDKFEHRLGWIFAEQLEQLDLEVAQYTEQILRPYQPEIRAFSEPGMDLKLIITKDPK